MDIYDKKTFANPYIILFPQDEGYPTKYALFQDLYYHMVEAYNIHEFTCRNHTYLDTIAMHCAMY